MSLSRSIKTIQDILRKDAGLDGDPQRISQLVWMLFLKMFDDTEVSNKTPIPEKFKWKRWTKSDLTDKELISFVNNELFPALKSLPDVTGQVPRAKLIEEIFQNAHNYMTSGSLMRQVIVKLDENFNFKDSKNRHLFNDIYETILKDIQNSRYSGEFYTPRAVTQFIVEIVDPGISDVILDPACGTGGFLASATEYVKSKLSSENKKWTDQQQAKIKGIEKKTLPYMLCVTNLLLHEIEVPNVIRDNAFSKPLNTITEKEQANVIVTNPPFGGTEEEIVLKGFTKEFSTKETADLFLLLILQTLKPGGRAGVILPDGFLFGSGIKAKIKEKLLTECNLQMIYKLPRGVFSPYTDISSNILFFEKGTPTKETWYYEHPLPESRNGRPYNKSNPIQLNEFITSKHWWKNKKNNALAWCVSMKEIKSRDYNLDIKNPTIKEKEKLQSTDKILKELFSNQEDIKLILNKIELEFTR
jgi:type I restriction enzyme M protein